MNIQSLHERAVRVAKEYQRNERELVEILQALDQGNGIRQLHYTSLYVYCVKALGLSDNVAVCLVTVARKGRKIPELKESFANGELTLTNAKRVSSILTPANQSVWIEKAKTLTTAKLDLEIAKEFPKEGRPERVKPISENRMEMVVTISAELHEQLKRIQDLESTRLGHAVSLEDAIRVAAETHLHKNDPIQKAERARATKSGENVLKHTFGERAEAGEIVEQSRFAPGIRTPIPAAEEHAVRLRDGDRCTHHTPHGRCEGRRWLHLHHVILVSEGGTNTRDNLALLCSAHHKMHHERQIPLKTG